MKTHTIAVTNQKGGSGKTSTAVNLAAALAERGKRVLLIDLDPQASASSWLRVEGGKDFLDVLTYGGDLAALVQPTGVPLLDILPASPWLSRAERSLASEPGAERILSERMEDLPAGRWPYVLLDCPPALGLLAFMALCAASSALLAVEASAMAVSGLAEITRTLASVRKRLNPELALLGVVLCRADLRTRVAREVETLIRERFGAAALKTRIRQDARLLEAPSHGLPLLQYAPRCRAADDYRALAGEIIERTTKGKA